MLAHIAAAVSTKRARRAAPSAFAMTGQPFAKPYGEGWNAPDGMPNPYANNAKYSTAAAAWTLGAYGRATARPSLIRHVQGAVWEVDGRLVAAYASGRVQFL